MNKPHFALSLIGAFSLTLLAGCTMEPDYQRPALPVASNWTAPKPVLRRISAGKPSSINRR